LPPLIQRIKAQKKAMVAAMRKALDGAGVKDDKIRTEEFTGY